MNIIGHTAIAYLLIKLLHVWLKKELHPRLIIFIFVFANILDSLHFGSLRIITHNSIGAIIYSGIWIIIFIKLNVVYKNEVVFLFLAVFTHILTDLMFSHFCLFFPFTTKYNSIWGFNSVEHLSAGIFSTLLFIIILISSEDYQKLKTYLRTKKQEIFESFRRKFLLTSDVVIMSLFIIYYLFLLVQFPIALLGAWNRLAAGSFDSIIRWIFLLFFIAEIYIFSALILNTFFNKK